VVARWVGWVVDGRVFEGGFWGCAFQVGLCGLVLEGTGLLGSRRRDAMLTDIAIR
jgi:hypothetical protein